MGHPDPRTEAFYADATRWPAELAALREILLACPVAEVFKWRAPCFTAAGGNIATIWGLKDACVLGFFKGAFLKDPARLLTAPGAHSRSVRTARFTSLAEIAARKATLKDYIREAIEVEKAGLNVEPPKDDPAYPHELTGRLNADPKLAEALAALTPGRRRGYILQLAQAKQSTTRAPPGSNRPAPASSPARACTTAKAAAPPSSVLQISPPEAPATWPARRNIRRQPTTSPTRAAPAAAPRSEAHWHPPPRAPAAS